ncbi:hypothetical protein GCM10025883_10130 [Mobilicoccus caccae]|uniref:Uncharacterized protein n=1 Tax=Mobilicoccus caccae TaxID=1859295 RepID=A0ABQ6IP12_9MICO|nr:hypothetical protein GCM10025883_10130 [Mobilicoccus caccae]
MAPPGSGLLLGRAAEAAAGAVAPPPGTAPTGNETIWVSSSDAESDDTQNYTRVIPGSQAGDA